MKVFFVLFAVLTLSLICASLDPEEKRTKEMLRARICNTRPEYGFCKGRRSMWFYNGLHKRCETFVYSNCGGNRNKFFSEEQCINFCIEKIRS